MSATSKVSKFFTPLIFIFLLVAGAVAQVTTADLVGTVTDTAGRVVAGAKITVTNQATNQSRTTVADDAGAFSIPNLQPGNYTVSVEAATFSKTIMKDVQLNVGTARNVTVELKAGQVSEVVEVTDEGALVETTRSDLDTSISPQEIENLPLLNRTFSNLAVIAPEARPVGNFDPTKTRLGTVAFNGGDGRQVNVNVDGGDNKDNVVGSLLQNFAYESIQEFQVQQHRWALIKVARSAVSST